MELSKIKQILEDIQKGPNGPAAKLVAGGLMLAVAALESGIDKADRLAKLSEEDGDLLKAKYYRECSEEHTAAVCAELEHMMRKGKLIKEEGDHESK